MNKAGMNKAGMNKPGSGHYPDSIGEPRQDRLPDLTMVEIRQQNVFGPQKGAIWSSTNRQGKVTALSVFIHPDDDDKLCVGILPPADKMGEQNFVEAEVKLGWAACNYGGRQALFLCPGRLGEPCGRRALHLYVDGVSLVCRHCTRINYLCYQPERHFRRLLQKQKILRSLGRVEGL